MKTKALIIGATILIAGTGTGFCATGQTGGQKMMQMDANNDGMISREEYDQYKEDTFIKYDRNNDGMLNQEEMRDMNAAKSAQQMQQSKKSGQDTMGMNQPQPQQKSNMMR